MGSTQTAGTARLSAVSDLPANRFENGVMMVKRRECLAGVTLLAGLGLLAACLTPSQSAAHPIPVGSTASVQLAPTPIAAKHRRSPARFCPYELFPPCGSVAHPCNPQHIIVPIH